MSSWWGLTRHARPDPAKRTLRSGLDVLLACGGRTLAWCAVRCRLRRGDPAECLGERFAVERLLVEQLLHERIEAGAVLADDRCCIADRGVDESAYLDVERFLLLRGDVGKWRVLIEEPGAGGGE